MVHMNNYTYLQQNDVPLHRDGAKAAYFTFLLLILWVVERNGAM